MEKSKKQVDESKEPKIILKDYDILFNVRLLLIWLEFALMITKYHQF